MSFASPIYVYRPRSSPNPVFNLNALPPETWIHVFEALSDPRDLYNLIRTCKYLHSLAIRSLYRSLKFSNPLGFLRNVPFWERQDTAMDTVPTSLTVSMPYFSQRATWGGRFDTSSDLLFSNGTFMSLRAYAMSFNNMYPWLESTPSTAVPSQQSIDNPQLDLSQINFTATDDIYSLLCTRIRSFVNLRELVFQNNALPGEVYDVIKSLPSLRKLAFNRCYLPEPAFAQPDEFVELPITEFVIKRIKDEDSTQRYRYRRALRICYAPNITVLDVDWDPISARILAGLLPPDSPDKPLPPVAPHLHTFYLYSAGQWPQDAGIEMHRPFEKFLLEHQGIKTLHIRRFNGIPRVPPGILPNLQVYHGPMCTVVPLVITETPLEEPNQSSVAEDYEDTSYPLLAIPKSAAASQVREIYLTDAGTDKRVDKLVRTLRRLAGLPIETLSIPMPRWDIEVIFPLTLHFPTLRRLEVKYVSSWPDEQTMISLGPQFLVHLPQLEVLHIYNPITPRCTCLSSRALEFRLSTISSPASSSSPLFSHSTMDPYYTPFPAHAHGTPVTFQIPTVQHPPVSYAMVQYPTLQYPLPPPTQTSQTSSLDNDWDNTETDPYILSQYTDLPLEDLENIAYEGPGCPRFPEVFPRINAVRKRRAEVGPIEMLDEEGVMDVIFAWRKSCPTLREVRIQREWVYKRPSDKWEWKRDRYQCQ